ncbi:MAG TPA: metalloregulator ArsR/SmtB family transcription factor [Desulfopila sp.]|nr:metalloregulator ArsR/SmtB family transcription factor [Desulfopila sp.]
MKTKDRCDTRIIHMEKIRAAKNSSLPDGELDALSQFFKTFADPSRVKILMALGQQEMCVCDLAAFLDISQSAVSHQLRYLRSCRLVRNRRDGTVLYYRLVDKHVVEIIGKGLEHIREL